MVIEYSVKEAPSEAYIEYCAESYGADLCMLCRECDCGKEFPCGHKEDALFGYKAGFWAGVKYMYGQP